MESKSQQQPVEQAKLMTMQERYEKIKHDLKNLTLEDVLEWLKIT